MFERLFCFYMALGIPGSGSAGIIYTLQVISDSKIAAAVCCGITASLWIACALLSLRLYYSVHRHYRQRGHSLEDAQKEAAKGVAGNNFVQGMVMKSATAGFV